MVALQFFLKVLINSFIWLYDIVYRWSNFKKQKQLLNLKNVTNILITEVSGIGDVVATLPALDVIRKKFQNAKISYLVSPLCLDIIKFDPRVNYTRILPQKINFKNLIKFLIATRRARYDLVIVLNYKIIHSIIAYTCGAKWLLGYLVDRDLKMKYIKDLYIEARGFHLPPKKYLKYEHIVNRPLKVIECIGDHIHGQMRLNINDEHIKYIQKKNWGNVRKTGFTIVFHLGADWEFRQWSVKRFSEVGNIINRKYDVTIILLGGKDEMFLSKHFQNSVAFKPINLVGQLSLGQSVAVISEADLFIGADSGPMHIAAAVGTPIVALFGPNIPKKSGPWGNAIIVSKQVPCSPCNQKKCVLKNNIPCMKRIQVKDVVEAIYKILTSDICLPVTGKNYKVNI